MFSGNASVASWDNSTRGLDASTALDYAKSLRLLTDIMQMTTFVSLYQAGEGIYQQFDKVLVLNESHVVYYGPATEARKYMIGLGYADQPRQTTADYLSGCTDPNERRFQEGRSADNVPSTAETMEKAFLESEVHARMVAEKDAYKTLMREDAATRDEFRAAVSEQR
jgi:ABC-type multidrug transport system ATPase subunit